METFFAALESDFAMGLAALESDFAMGLVGLAAIILIISGVR